MDEILDGDNGLNLYYHGARYHAPDIGALTQIDPQAGRTPGWSPYVYTLDNPMKYVDDRGDSVRAPTDDPYTSTYVDMARSGELGAFAQEQIAAVDALSFDVEFVSGQITEKMAGDHLGGLTRLTRRPDNGEVVSASVTVDVRNIEKTGRNVPTTSVHEFDHVLEGSKKKGQITEPEKKKYEDLAQKAEAKFRKSFKGNTQYFRTIRLYNKKVKENANQIKREQN